jgi:hypothetical protein
MMSFLFAESPSSGQAETRPIERTIYSRAEFRSLHLTEEIFSAFLDPFASVCNHAAETFPAVTRDLN